MNTLLHNLQRMARDDANRLCVRDPDGRAWTWQQVNATANGIAAELGPAPAPETPIAIQLPPGGMFWAACVAVSQQGYDALLLPEHPHRSLADRVAREIPVQRTIDAETVDEWSAAASHASTVRASEPRASGHCGGFVLVSSGTTGFPQLVRRSARTVELIAQGLVGNGLYAPQDVVGSFLPMHHAYGFEHGFVGPLCAGATVLQGVSFDTHGACQLLAEGVTVVPLVPATMAALCDCDPVPHALRCAVSAGSPLSAATRRSFQERWGVNAVDLYGATELGTIWLDRGSGGIPVDGVSICIAQPGSAAVPTSLPAGHEGEVVVASRTRFDWLVSGGRTSADQSAVRTGDLGVQQADGSYRITGRIKLVFDVGGLKVNPYEVEAAIAEHPSVRAAIVEPVQASQDVLRVGARVELKLGCHLDAATLRQFLHGRVPAHAMPRAIDLDARLPRTPSGKILRSAPVSAGAR